MLTKQRIKNTDYYTHLTILADFLSIIIRVLIAGLLEDFCAASPHLIFWTGNSFSYRKIVDVLSFVKFNCTHSPWQYTFVAP
jgi:hypothetical protein